MKDKLLNLLKETKLDLTKACLIPSSGEGFNKNVFEITPKDFLRFAKHDLKQNDERGFINSLTNSKRAIDCQVDEALEKLGIGYQNFSPETTTFLKHFDLNDDIPIKLKIIHALNLAPSLIISKTRTLRNKLEHIYQKPTLIEVQEALDVADLLIRSIEGKLRIIENDFSLTDENNYNEENHWTFNNGLEINFSTTDKKFEIRKRVNSKMQGGVTTILPKDKEFCCLIRLMFSIDDDIEIEESFKAILKQIEHPIPTEKVSIIQG